MTEHPQPAVKRTPLAAGQPPYSRLQQTARAVLLALCGTGAIAPIAGWTQNPPATTWDEVTQPDGFRTDNYDDIVPEALSGATVVDDVDVVRLRESGAALIDVIPEVRPPKSLPANQLWLPPPHQSIPGALWLPDTGYGKLTETTAAWFRQQLDDASNGNPDHPLIFFCRDNCWMSWNAAKRALQWGYRQVYWYPEGTDGWFAADRPFAAIAPAPGARH